MVYLAGVRKDLPYAPEIDEPLFVSRAVSIASSGDLSPHWFGHPGSTVIYPLAAIYRLRGLPARPDDLVAIGDLYLTGRVLTVGFALLAIPVTYLLGRATFGEPEALAGAWLALLSPVAMDHAQTIRTDSAGVLCTVLGLWLCLRLLAQPTPRNQLLAGIAIGLGISTRYFLVTLVSVLVLVDLLILLGVPRGPAGTRLRSPLAGVLLGLAAVAIGFVLTTPFFFPELATARLDIAHEARSSHPGADGFGYAGNLLWYLRTAIPGATTPLLALLSMLGVIVSLWRRSIGPLLLFAFGVIFVTAVSLSPLHWVRWILPLVPLLALFAAAAIAALARALASLLGASRAVERAVGFGLVAAISIGPGIEMVQLARSEVRPSTTVVARDWIVANLPASSKIAQEFYTAPLGGTEFSSVKRFSLARDRRPTPQGIIEQGFTFEDYEHEHFDYLMVSDAIYDRYLFAPGRYPAEAAFYGKLFRSAKLVREFKPEPDQRGPTLRIYRLESVR